jgi:YD repeat-containing protein
VISGANDPANPPVFVSGDTIDGVANTGLVETPPNVSSSESWFVEVYLPAGEVKMPERVDWQDVQPGPHWYAWDVGVVGGPPGGTWGGLGTKSSLVSSQSGGPLGNWAEASQTATLPVQGVYRLRLKVEPAADTWAHTMAKVTFTKPDGSALDGVTPCDQSVPSKSENSSPCGNKAAGGVTDGQATTGNPVNTLYGNESETATDVSAPTRGFPLEVHRCYNSASSGVDTDGLGWGWSLSGMERLQIAGGGGDVTLVLANGATARFLGSAATASAAGRFVSSPWVTASLTQAPTSPGPADYTVTFSGGEVDVFDAATGRLKSRADRNGHRLDYDYNADGLVQFVTDRAGAPGSTPRRLEYRWKPAGSVAGTSKRRLDAVEEQPTSDPVVVGRRVVFGYDAAGNLASAATTDAAANAPDTSSYTWSYTYTNHLLVTATSPEQSRLGAAGKATVNTWDDTVLGADAKVSFQQSPTGSPTSRLRFEYDTPAAGDTTVTDEDGYKRVDHYDNGQRTSVTYGAGSAAPVTYSFDYDRGTGRVTGVYSGTGAGRVQLWSYGYDGRGNLRSATQRSDTAGGDRTTSWGAYNRFDQPTSVTDPVGTVTSFTYDSGGPLTNGNVTQVDVVFDHDADPSTAAVTATTRYGYDAVFDLVSVTSPEQVAAGPAGTSWAFGYDPFGQPWTVTDPVGNVSVTAFDALGRPSFQIPSVGTKVAPTDLMATNPFATTYTTDAKGRVLTATDANGHATTWTYDGDGNPTTVTDADAKTVSYAYDAAGRPTCALRGDGSATYTAYTPAGRVSEQADTKATVAGCPADRPGWGTQVSVTATGGGPTVGSTRSPNRLATSPAWRSRRSPTTPRAGWRPGPPARTRSPTTGSPRGNPRR